LSTVAAAGLWIAEGVRDGTPDRSGERLNLSFDGEGVIFDEPRAAKKQTDRAYAEMSDPCGGAAEAKSGGICRFIPSLWITHPSSTPGLAWGKLAPPDERSSRRRRKKVIQSDPT
jgi:hypothetical protein